MQFTSPEQDGSLPLFAFRRAEPPVEFEPNTPIEKLASYRLELQCCAAVMAYPLQLLASSLPQGGRTPLAAALGLFRCERCGKPARGRCW
jgi:hypothetical protein